ncbi:MAG: hypothetical protein M1570_13770 [Chloroflexi bacterium]|nr:hypothetical protein [Chloroflexota bacterium]
MAKQPHPYWAFMLRLWQVRSGSAVAWRASLEDPHTGERKGFADLESLLAFLQERTAGGSGSASPIDRERNDNG